MSMATSVVDFDENDDGEFSLKSLMTALESKKSQAEKRPPHVLVELPGVVKKFFASQSNTDEWRVIWRGQYKGQGTKLATDVAQLVAKQVLKQRRKMEKAVSKLVITQDMKEISARSHTRQISRNRIDIGTGGDMTPAEDEPPVKHTEMKPHNNHEDSPDDARHESTAEDLRPGKEAAGAGDVGHRQEEDSKNKPKAEANKDPAKDRSRSPSPAKAAMSLLSGMGAAAVGGGGGASEKVVNHTREAMKGKAIIVVKELLPEGSVLVTASYRVEVLAAGGKKLGYTEIENEDDLRAVVGNAKVEELMPPDRSQWKMKAIFHHVVQDRIVLKMSKDGETDTGVSRSGKSVGNVITLIRDTIAKPPADDGKRIKRNKLPPPLAPGEIRPQQIIVLQKTQQMVGMPFHSVFMLRARVLGFRSNPDRFFQVNPDQHWCLRQVDVIISSRCIRTGYTARLELSGRDMDAWLPEVFPLDLSKKFRRSKFATFVLLHLHVNYKPGDYAAFSVGLRQSRLPVRTPKADLQTTPSTPSTGTGSRPQSGAAITRHPGARPSSARPQSSGRPQSALRGTSQG
jgi:hypothetical protein